MTTTCNLPIDILTMIGDFSGLEFSTQEYKRKSNYKKGYKINKMVKICDLCRTHNHKIATYYKCDRNIYHDYLTKPFMHFMEESNVCSDCIVEKNDNKYVYGNKTYDRTHKVSLVNPKFINGCKNHCAFYTGNDMKPIVKVNFRTIIVELIKDSEGNDVNDIKTTNSFILKSKVDKVFGIKK